MPYETASKQSLPYTYARVSVMKKELMRREDYHRLLKMDLNSITRHLQDTKYKESITKLSTTYSGAELVDRALQREEYRVFNKLREISPPSVVAVIDLYLGRYDYYNLKIVIRGILSNAKEIESFLMPIGKFRKEHFVKLFEKGNIKDALMSSHIVSEKDLGDSLEEYNRSGNIMELENQLDKLSFRKAMKGAKKLTAFGRQFSDFLLINIDVINIRNLIRFKREGLESSKIMKYMILKGKKLNKEDLESLARMDSYKAIIKSLKKSYFSRFIDFDEEADPFDIEMELQRNLMKRSLSKSYGDPMSVECVLQYMMARIIETRNLRGIIKSKHFGIDPAFFEKKMLIV